MYPLLWILGCALLRSEAKLLRVYALPFALLGFFIALYHNLLYYKILEDSIVPCSTGVSCTSRQIEWAGFITIPLLSLTAFSLITLLLLLVKKEKSR
jgi:disulfide bond formation protein DsbB